MIPALSSPQRPRDIPPSVDRDRGRLCADAKPMTLEQNKAIAKRFIHEVFVNQDEQAADQLTAPDFVPHSWPGVEPGVQSLKAAQRRVSAGLDDARMTIEDMIAEGDKVAV